MKLATKDFALMSLVFLLPCLDLITGDADIHLA